MNAGSSPVRSDPRADQSARREFLARVRSALGRTAPLDTHPEPIQVEDRLFRLAQATEDIVSLFAHRAAAAGMAVLRCTEDSLADELAALIARLSVRRIVARVADEGLAPAVQSLSGRAPNAAVFLPDAASIDSCFDADAGITDVAAAIAESGSLVISSEVHGRAAFIVPPQHIALVRSSRIVPDLLDLWSPGTAAPPMPASLVLVTGPSKTADIEGVLVTGVHGPRDVHVVVIDPV